MRKRDLERSNSAHGCTEPTSGGASIVRGQSPAAFHLGSSEVSHAEQRRVTSPGVETLTSLQPPRSPQDSPVCLLPPHKESQFQDYDFRLFPNYVLILS